MSSGFPVHSIVLPDRHVISDERERHDMDFVHASLADTYWGADRPRALTERCWANSLCLGVYAVNGEQAGFARVLTDYALRAHLTDVFVRRSSRGLGLGKALIEAILNHPALSTVDHWTLSTDDAQGLYARHGFTPGAESDRWMSLVRVGPEERR
jgi:GNAT superfamily N-acetyltransferase